MDLCLVRISLPLIGEVACVESPPTKAAALDKMAQEDGYDDFAALCRDRLPRRSHAVTEIVLEQSERLDGTALQTARLEDGSEIVREAPEGDRAYVAPYEAAARREGWTQNAEGLWCHPKQPLHGYIDVEELCEEWSLDVTGSE